MYLHLASLALSPYREASRQQPRTTLVLGHMINGMPAQNMGLHEDSFTNGQLNVVSEWLVRLERRYVRLSLLLGGMSWRFQTTGAMKCIVMDRETWNAKIQAVEVSNR